MDGTCTWPLAVGGKVVIDILQHIAATGLFETNSLDHLDASQVRLPRRG
jgi:alcohol dehydrogenase YqhD (iron-dependent ADH family)